MKTHDWPPLITDAVRPRWMLWRDRMLTLLVWILFLMLFTEQWRGFQTRLEAYFSTPGAELEFVMAPFFAVVGIMVAWLVFTAFFTYRRATRARLRSPPPPLPLEQEAAHFGVAQEALAAARMQQIIAVNVGAGGKLSFEPLIYTAAAGGIDRPEPALPDRSAPGR